MNNSTTLRRKKEETFLSNARCSTKAEALEVLDSIRKVHSNWKEIKKGTKVFMDNDGKWRAQRHHIFYY